MDGSKVMEGGERQKKRGEKDKKGLDIPNGFSPSCVCPMSPHLPFSPIERNRRPNQKLNPDGDVVINLPKFNIVNNVQASIGVEKLEGRNFGVEDAT